MISSFSIPIIYLGYQVYQLLEKHFVVHSTLFSPNGGRNALGQKPQLHPQGWSSTADLDQSRPPQPTGLGSR